MQNNYKNCVLITQKPLITTSSACEYSGLLLDTECAGSIKMVFDCIFHRFN